jgi:hypothetical protein
MSSVDGACSSDELRSSASSSVSTDDSSRRTHTKKSSRFAVVACSIAVTVDGALAWRCRM